MSEFKEIWNKLSGIDVTDRIKQKGGFNYLPWAWAWGVLMEHYPDAEYSFKNPVFYNDGTCEVWAKVTIGSCKRAMWLPVMNFKNVSIKDPSSKDISDTRMRCLVKCIAMFGLGHYIYAAEELPELRGQTTGELLNFDVINQACKFFQKSIDEDKENYLEMQDLEKNLNRKNNDYMIEVYNQFGKMKCEGHPRKRQYKNILADILKIPLDGDGNPLPVSEPEEATV